VTEAMPAGRSESGTRGSAFDRLGPLEMTAAVEAALGGRGRLNGTVTAYPSYVNRVYGFGLDEGGDIIAKFYRPGRWSRAAVLEEHRFVMDCAEAELPVVAPMPLATGETLGELCLDGDGTEGGPVLFFALFPKRGGRNFDAERGEDWLRLGGLVARCHVAGDLRPSPNRLRCDPRSLTASLAQGLLDQGLVHPKLEERFARLCSETLEYVSPLFSGLHFGRIHGDCHRGNILDRPGEGLLLIDFDDMMVGPRVQDLWLLLPDHAATCRAEIAALVEGYEQFKPFDPRELRLIESLRFMRMIYFLAWRSMQRDDAWFAREFPDWGGEAFWIREMEDLQDQADILREELEG